MNDLDLKTETPFGQTVRRATTPPLNPPPTPDHELLRRIGRGSYGEVWLARGVTGAYRAVKIVRRESFEHERPFEREFSGILQFEPLSRKHESQVDILHVGRGEGYFYYIMELADDQFSGQQINPDSYAPRTVKSDLFQRGKLPFEECVQISLALTTALEHLHSHGLVHRDIKPSNIIFVNGVPKLADIGLVTGIDATRSYVGTEGFAPPEGPGTPHADLYSLGKVLYEMATGKDRQDFPELPTNLAALPECEGLVELNAVIAKACRHNPSERYKSADEMHKDLLLLQSGKSLAKLRSVERRLTVAKRFGIAALVSAVVIAVAFLYQARQTEIVKRLATENLALAKQSEANAQESRSRLVQLQVAKGTEQMNKGELSDSLNWFSAALANVTNDPRANELHRIRIQSVLDNHPKLTHLFAHEGRVFRAAFTPDGSSLVTHSAPDVLKVFDLATGELKFSLVGTNRAYQPHPSSYSPALIFNAEGSRVIIRGLVAGVDTEIFDLQERLQVTYSSTNGSQWNRILDCTDGRHALVQTGSSTAQFVDLDTAEALSAKMQTTGEIITGRLSQQNTAAALLFKGSAITTKDKIIDAPVTRLQVWNVKSGEVIGPPVMKDYRFDGRFLLADEGKQAVLTHFDSQKRARTYTLRFNMESGGPLDQDAEVLEEYECLSVQRGGQWVALKLPKGGKRLQNVESGESVTLDEPGAIRYIGFSPDGLLVATATDDGTVRVWSKATGELLLPILRHALWAYGAEFSPEGTRLATCSEDRTVRVWDLTASSQPRLSGELESLDARLGRCHRPAADTSRHRSVG